MRPPRRRIIRPPMASDDPPPQAEDVVTEFVALDDPRLIKMRLSRTTLYRLQWRGEINHYKIGASTVVDMAEILAYIRRNKVKRKGS
jgi:Helix-turn-helix domain